MAIRSFNIIFAMMLPNYKVLQLFENTQIMILEIKIHGLNEEANRPSIYYWLYFNKLSLSLIRLWLRSSDSSSEIEERYFEQGYLKYSGREATFIEKFNSCQHKLINDIKVTLNPDTQRLIGEYLREG
ncbi:hypothetical protein [Pedobacter miscanthi]|uniref:hypothetical protein n=1 Tax=Pedobacter miscanthi TaxID=2259170 RepID=UPI00293064E9|nr:hypothetical protein [Pedobacter miscanthi]